MFMILELSSLLVHGQKLLGNGWGLGLPAAPRARLAAAALRCDRAAAAWSRMAPCSPRASHKTAKWLRAARRLLNIEYILKNYCSRLA